MSTGARQKWGEATVGGGSLAAWVPLRPERCAGFWIAGRADVGTRVGVSDQFLRITLHTIRSLQNRTKELRKERDRDRV